MPNRIIKESVCTSESIDQLSWFEEVLFYRMIVNCDDYGRFDGRPAVIKSRLFPLKDNITAKSIDAAINKLVSAELVVLYVFEGKPYLHLPSWDKHQQIRAKRSKYPAPADAITSFDSTCNQMLSNVPVIQSESESESKSKSKSETSRASAFDAWWKIYPKKVGKEAARKAFAKVKVPVETLISAVESQKSSEQWCKNNGQFIPNPTTWLNQGRWSDELHMKEGSSFQSNKVDANAADEQARMEAMLANLAR